MMASHHFTRVDTLELKDLIYQKIGHQRAEMYFNQLKRFLSLKLSKSDFDKSCLQTIGRENISLHNQLIRSIIQNACHSKTPPLKPQKTAVKIGNGYQRTCLQSLYGDAFPQSPRKCRSPINRDRKFRDRPSPLGPFGKSPSTRTQEQQSPTDLHSLGEDDDEVEQISRIPIGPITAPYGVCVNNNTQKSLHSGFGFCQNSGELLDSRTLRGRLEKKLSSEGVGISMECANVLNRSLDVYLKRLIEPCIGIAGKYGHGPVGPKYAASMLDFRVAMESNPSILGQDWSTQLEKICHYDIM